MGEIIAVILSLLGVIGLVFLTYFASKWLNRRFSTTSARSIKILEKAALGQDKSVAIVKVGTKLMLLGITTQHIEKLSDLDESDITEYLNDTPAPINSAFLENLKKATLEHRFIKPFIPKEKQGEHNDEQ